MIGSNNRQTRFRILMVDRKVQTELKITDDKKEYNIHEISEVSLSDARRARTWKLTIGASLSDSQQNLEQQSKN